MPRRREVPVQEAIGLYLSGESMAAIARHFGCSEIVIRLRFKEANVPLRRSHFRGPVEVDPAVLRAMYDEALSVLEMAKRLGVSRSVINARLEAIGLPARSASQAQYIRNARYTPEQRKQYAEAAHAAVRGKTISEEKVRRMVAGQAGRIKSELERQFMERFHECGFAVQPGYQVERYLLDLALPDVLVGIEVDGGEWHATEKKRKSDMKKGARLTELGWTVVRVRERDLGRFDEVITRVQVACGNPATKCEEGVQRSDPEVVDLHDLVSR